MIQSQRMKFMSFIHKIILLFGIFFVYPTYSWGQQNYQGPISLSMGGSGRAAIEAEEGFWLNPAVLSHAKDFSSGVFYSDGLWHEGHNETTYGLSLIDNTEDVLIPGGFSFLNRSRNISGWSPVNEQSFTASIGKFVSHYISSGASIHYRILNPRNGPAQHIWNGSLGFLWVTDPNWGIGLVWDRLVHQNKWNPSLSPELKDVSELSLGVHIIYQKIFRIRLDGSQSLENNPNKKLRWGFGVETLINELNAIRIGGENNDLTRRRALTLGWGFVGPRLRIDYGFRHEWEDGGRGMHSVDFRIPF